MATGYVSIHRELHDHWVWDDKPFSKGQAWIDLIMLANHKESKFLLGNQLVEVERGEVITSELKLMERWGWSKTKVRSFLELLQMDKMLIKKSDKKKTALIICNYNDWQDSQTTKEPQEDYKETTKEPQQDTINNVNNLNKDNKDNKKDLKDSLSDEKPPDEPKLKKLNPDADPLNKYNKAAVHFAEMVLKANPTCKVPKQGTAQMGRWATEIRLMYQSDKRDVEEVRQTLEHCFTHDVFWKHTCQSPANFRSNYDKIRGSYLKGRNSVKGSTLSKTEAFKESVTNGPAAAFLRRNG